MDRRRPWKTPFIFSVVLHVCIIIAAGLFNLNLYRTSGNADSGLTIQLTGNNGNGNGSSGGSAAAVGQAMDKMVLGSEKNIVAVQQENKVAADDSNVTKSLDDSVSMTKSNITNSDSHAQVSVGMSGSGQETGANSGTGSGSGNDFGSGEFGTNADGTYTALDSQGISYTILSDPEALYPDEARSIGYNRTVSVEAKILVGLNGYVEKVEIFNNAPNLGFREAAEAALQAMRFAPIYYRGHNIKMYFVKTIHFQP